MIGYYLIARRYEGFMWADNLIFSLSGNYWNTKMNFSPKLNNYAKIIRYNIKIKISQVFTKGIILMKWPHYFWHNIKLMTEGTTMTIIRKSMIWHRLPIDHVFVSYPLLRMFSICLITSIPRRYYGFGSKPLQ